MNMFVSLTLFPLTLCNLSPQYENLKKKSFKEQGNCHHISVVSGRCTLKGLPAEKKTGKTLTSVTSTLKQPLQAEKTVFIAPHFFSLKENCLQITIIINEHY